jgi:hypothetical protein
VDTTSTFTSEPLHQPCCIMVRPLCQHLAMSHGSGIIATEEVHVGVRPLHIPVDLLKCLVVLQA